MAWCPKCKAQYVDGITICADCKVELVDSPSIQYVEKKEEPEPEVFKENIEEEEQHLTAKSKKKSSDRKSVV